MIQRLLCLSQVKLLFAMRILLTFFPLRKPGFFRKVNNSPGMEASLGARKSAVPWFCQKPRVREGEVGCGDRTDQMDVRIMELIKRAFVLFCLFFQQMCQTVEVFKHGILCLET